MPYESPEWEKQYIFYSLLLKKLHSVKRIQGAELEELMNIVGESKAQIIYNFFRDKKAEETVEE